MLHIIQLMRKKCFAFFSLFLLLASIVFTLSACEFYIYDSTEEEPAAQTTEAVTSPDAATKEEAATTSLDSKWKDYELTSNEIDYNPSETPLDEDGYYTSQDDVATYLIEYETLPDNFITKKEAKALGWNGGSLEPYGEDMCIGGDYFGNYEGLLPEVKGRTYYECDIDTMGANKRGAKRIIYSNDGQIYYTDDHYESFTLIYGTDQ